MLCLTVRDLKPMMCTHVYAHMYVLPVCLLLAPFSLSIANVFVCVCVYDSQTSQLLLNLRTKGKRNNNKTTGGKLNLSRARSHRKNIHREKRYYLGFYIFQPVFEAKFMYKRIYLFILFEFRVVLEWRIGLVFVWTVFGCVYNFWFGVLELYYSLLLYIYFFLHHITIASWSLSLCHFMCIHGFHCSTHSIFK